MMALLLDEGVYINQAAPLDEITPLHMACQLGQEDKVALLLERWANVNLKTTEGETPLDIAKREGHATLVAMLENAHNHA